MIAQRNHSVFSRRPSVNPEFPLPPAHVGTPRPLPRPAHTAWLPRSCSSGDMAAATMSFGLVRTVPQSLVRFPRPEQTERRRATAAQTRHPHERPAAGDVSVTEVQIRPLAAPSRCRRPRASEFSHPAASPASAATPGLSAAGGLKTPPHTAAAECAGKYNCPVSAICLPWIHDNSPGAQATRTYESGAAVSGCPDRRVGHRVSANRHVPQPLQEKVYPGRFSFTSGRIDRPRKPRP